MTASTRAIWRQDHRKYGEEEHLRTEQEAFEHKTTYPEGVVTLKFRGSVGGGIEVFQSDRSWKRLD
jgi:hypothetical protein